MIFNAYTDFTFPKDGDPGTNGTDFVAKLSPNRGSERIYVRNYLNNSFNSDTSAYDDTGQSSAAVTFELYNNSQKIGDHISFGDNVTWQCPIKNDQRNNQRYITYCTCSRGQISRNNFSQEDEFNIEDVLNIFKTICPLNIIRAKYVRQNITYYAECPVNYSFTTNRNYRLRISPKTGFKYVVYSEDGTSPNYDNTVPFKIIFEKQIQKENNYYWIKDQSNLSFNWDVIGNLEIVNGEIKPKDTFDGGNLANAIICSVKQGEEQIGFIHIPIYMILNRYGHQALNDWDGNSIELNDKGNYILAPQIGAGVKDSQNRFTGVFMGTIEGLEEGQSDKDRDRGIESDDRFCGLSSRGKNYLFRF